MAQTTRTLLKRSVKTFHAFYIAVNSRSQPPRVSTFRSHFGHNATTNFLTLFPHAIRHFSNRVRSYLRTSFFQGIRKSQSALRRNFLCRRRDPRLPQLRVPQQKPTSAQRWETKIMQLSNLRAVDFLTNFCNSATNCTSSSTSARRLTRQAELVKRDPALAERMRREASAA